MKKRIDNCTEKGRDEEMKNKGNKGLKKKGNKCYL